MQSTGLSEAQAMVAARQLEALKKKKEHTLSSVSFIVHYVGGLIVLVIAFGILSLVSGDTG